MRQGKKAKLDAKRIKTQCAHEAKKIEREMEKLKERMTKVQCSLYGIYCVPLMI